MIFSSTELKIVGRVFSAPFGKPKKLYLNCPYPADCRLLSFKSKEKKLTKYLYSSYVDLYDKHMEETGHYIAQSKVLNHVKDKIAEPVIDLASGTGYLIDQILKTHIVTEAFVNDISKKMLERAQKRLKSEKVYYSHNDASNMASNIQFKTIISCNFFFYISDKEKAIQSWKKILYNDGKIILLEEAPFLFPSPSEFQDFNNTLVNIHHYIKPKEIIALFEENNMILEEKGEERIDERHSLMYYIFINKLD